MTIDVKRAALNIEPWLNRNTFHHGDFADLGGLVRRKEALGLTISLCIPTLNEAATIGAEVEVFRCWLVQEFPLLDEIAVIDSGSTDGTQTLAAEAGAEVYQAGDIYLNTARAGGRVRTCGKRSTSSRATSSSMSMRT